MKREWQPGDLAMSDGFGVLLAGDDGFWYARQGRLNTPWRAMAGYCRFAYLSPLAVIDPQAAIPDEWVDVFVDAWDRSTDVRAGLAALFAHIATPPEPKPEEPMGDRATVRDRDGVLWTRDNDDPEKPWRNFCGAWHAWSDLDVPADGVLWGGVE